MEQQLTLEHLTPYLPYGLLIARKCPINKEYERSFEMVYQVGNTQSGVYGLSDVLKGKTLHGSSITPILRPLSDLTEEIRVKGFNNTEWFNPIEWIENNCSLGHEDLIKQILEDDRWINQLPKYIHDYLIKMNFDVFGLIEKGLAIDINTLDK